MKRILSVVFVIVLVLGMNAVTAFADTAYNGDVAGVLVKNPPNFTIDLTGDYNLHVEGQATGESGNYTYFEGTISGDFEGELVNGVVNAGGLDTLYADIINIPDCTDPVRLVGIFVQSGIDGDFEGQIITGTPPAPVNSLTIGTEGGVTEVTVGQTLQMTATTDPPGDYDINWSVYVNDRDKAWINADGVLHALAPGNVIVIANTEDPNVATDTMSVTVLDAETEVTADVSPTYTIMIPASVDFGTLVKDSGTVTQEFDVSAQGVVIENGASIGVDVTGPFVMKDEDGAGSIELPYSLSNESGAITSPYPATFANFTSNGIEEGSVSVDTGSITAAGSYKGTMIFTISYNY